MKRGVVGVILIALVIFSTVFISAGWFGDLFSGKSTGNVVYSGNILDNGDFSKGSQAWSYSQNANEGVVTFWNNQNGNYVSIQGYGYFYQEPAQLKGAAGKKYELSFNANAPNSEVVVAIQNLDNNWQAISGGYYYLGKVNGDTKFSRNFTIPSEGRYIVSFGTTANMKGQMNNVAYFGSVSLREITSICGNRVVESGEECDSGVDNGIGGVCTKDCKLVPTQNATCTDSDGGRYKYYSKGEIKVNGVVKNSDYCIEDDYLNEFYCTNSSQITHAMDIYDCASEGKVCSNGSCVEGNQTSPELFWVEEGYDYFVVSAPYETYILSIDDIDFSQVTFRDEVKGDIITSSKKEGDIIYLGNAAFRIEDIRVQDYAGGVSGVELSAANSNTYLGFSGCVGNDCALIEGERLLVYAFGKENTFDVEIVYFDSEAVRLNIDGEITGKLAQLERYVTASGIAVNIEHLGYGAGANIPYNGIEFTVELDNGGCIPRYYCTVDPVVCPQSGVQTKECYDLECGDSNNYQETISCTPGQCSGCDLDGRCIPYGFRTQVSGYNNVEGTYNLYCDIDGELKQQKMKDSDGSWAACQNNYECESNICSSGECVELADAIRQARGFKGFFFKTFCKIANPISRDQYNECVVNFLG